MCEIKLIRVTEIKKTIVNVYYKLDVIAPTISIYPSTKIINGCFKYITENEMFNIWVDTIVDNLYDTIGDNQKYVRNITHYFNKLLVKISFDKYGINEINLQILDKNVKKLFDNFIAKIKIANKKNKKKVIELHKTEIIDMIKNN